MKKRVIIGDQAGNPLTSLVWATVISTEPGKCVVALQYRYPDLPPFVAGFHVGIEGDVYEVKSVELNGALVCRQLSEP